MPSIDLASDVRHDRLEQVARRSFSTAAELLSFDRDDSLQAEERWSPGKPACSFCGELRAFWAVVICSAVHWLA